MALMSPIIGELSGSYGGLTYSHGKGGPYVRLRSIPTNPNSVKQTAARAALSGLSARYGELSADQRTEWSQWAELHPVVNRLGNAIILTGQQAYIGCNARLIQAGAPANDDCPVNTVPSDLATATATADASTQEITVTYSGAVPTGGRLLLWQTLPSSAGRNGNRRQSRLVGYSDVDPTSPNVWTSPYIALATQTSNLWVCVMDDAGQASPGLRVDVTYS